MSVNNELGSRLVEGHRTRSIIGGFYETFNTLRSGFLESVYVAALEKELRARGHRVERDVAVQVFYKGDIIARQRIDMLVDGSVIVEIKAGDRLPFVAEQQLLNYLRATGLQVGLLFHFGPRPKFYRVFNRHGVTHDPTDPSFPTNPKANPSDQSDPADLDG